MAGGEAGAPPAPGLAVGARVAIGRDRDKATVRYVGPVAGQAGVWVGVEWDDGSRGKHDGSTGGVKYFDVSGGPTAGSFVRAEKVHGGVPLLAALRARYNNETAEGGSGGPGADRAVYLSSSSGGRRVLVELVGEEQVTERQRQTQLLERARVVGAGVSAVVRGRRAGAGGGSGQRAARPPAATLHCRGSRHARGARCSSMHRPRTARRPRRPHARSLTASPVPSPGRGARAAGGAAQSAGAGPHRQPAVALGRARGAAGRAAGPAHAQP
jgi:hypothetical protein